MGRRQMGGPQYDAQHDTVDALGMTGTTTHPEASDQGAGTVVLAALYW